MAKGKKAQFKESAEQIAVRAYIQFLNYVTGKVEKLGGVENVLTDHENKWLRPHYDRVLNFAEKCQLIRVQQEKEEESDNPLDKLFQVNVTLSDNSQTETK